MEKIEAKNGCPYTDRCWIATTLAKKEGAQTNGAILIDCGKEPILCSRVPGPGHRTLLDYPNPVSNIEINILHPSQRESRTESPDP